MRLLSDINSGTTSFLAISLPNSNPSRLLSFPPPTTIITVLWSFPYPLSIISSHLLRRSKTRPTALARPSTSGTPLGSPLPKPPPSSPSVPSFPRHASLPAQSLPAYQLRPTTSQAHSPAIDVVLGRVPTTASLRQVQLLHRLLLLRQNHQQLLSQTLDSTSTQESLEDLFLLHPKDPESDEREGRELRGHRQRVRSSLGRGGARARTQEVEVGSLTCSFPPSRRNSRGEDPEARRDGLFGGRVLGGASSDREERRVP